MTLLYYSILVLVSVLAVLRADAKNHKKNKNKKKKKHLHHPLHQPQLQHGKLQSHPHGNKNNHKNKNNRQNNNNNHNDTAKTVTTLTHADLGAAHHQKYLRELFPSLNIGSQTQTHAHSHKQTQTQAPAHTDSDSGADSDTASPVIYVTDYGADPTGTVDSTTAFAAAVAAALTRGMSNATLAYGAKDLGGVTISLGGGDYLLSAPVVIPMNYGNLRIVDGTMRASGAFAPKKGGYMIVIGDSACNNGQGTCNENIGIENMMIDCRQICDGGIHVIKNMGTVIGPQMFFLGFNAAGVTISEGHETMISNAWFGEWLYSSSNKENGQTSVATGIEVFGNDHYVVNTVVFSARIGVHITHAANLLTGVHTWNLATANGGTGIYVDQTEEVRLLGCYLDWNDLVLRAPITAITAEDTFFLGGGTLRLVSSATASQNAIRGLTVANSVYQDWNHGGTDSIVLDESSGRAFAAPLTGVYFRNNYIEGGYTLKTTRASKALSQKMATQWVFDFSDVLAFAEVDIAWVDYSIEYASSDAADVVFVSHMALKPEGTKVTVVTSAKIDATVYCTVDQSTNTQY